jgi:hypothetical protein
LEDIQALNLVDGRVGDVPCHGTRSDFFGQFRALRLRDLFAVANAFQVRAGAQDYGCGAHGSEKAASPGFIDASGRDESEGAKPVLVP